MDECEQIFAKLYDVKTVKMGLDRVRKVDDLLGRPSTRFRAIHVAGTNGKGTVSTKIAGTLCSMGFKVGLFTSPHIKTFRERIQINGKLIDKEEALTGLKRIINFKEEVSFFEAMTLLAFCHFNRHGVDYAVIETGLGGRLDATNILHPILSVITNISFDHADILGRTLDKIGAEKAGIIKPKAPVVLGARATRITVLKKAFEEKSPIYFVKPCQTAHDENVSVAKTALKVVLSSDEINLTEESPPCRFEEHGDIIFDVAHNEDGVLQLFENVKRKYPHKKIYTIFSLSSSKEIEKIIGLFKENSDSLFYHSKTHPRLASYDDAAPFLPDQVFTNLDEFVDKARSESATILVTGSFFIMNEIKEKLGVSIQDVHALVQA